VKSFVADPAGGCRVFRFRAPNGQCGHFASVSRPRVAVLSVK
jgi:hypothetical protein